ncbi:MAG: VWA domain-containing protein [Thiomargarita sp.]|nr:VWA domain-containing protein [Thiomargarita sp.]
MLAHFYFTRPFWFLALLPVMFLLWWQLTVHREEVWQKVCDPHLLPHLLVNVRQRQKYVPLILLGLGWLLTILALAGPTWSKSPQSLYRSQLATVLLLDLSRSMDAQDISPSRLSRARHKIWEILKRAKEGQTALLVFAGDVHIVSPLTDDAATIASLIPALNTDLMPILGTQTHLALQKAGELLERAGKIILITDGLEDIKKSIAAAHRLKSQGHQLSILGVGTDEGAPIPLKKGKFIKDKQGLTVQSRLETEMLIALAKAGGGVYSALTTDNSDLKKLLKSPRFDSGSELMNQQGGQDQGYWLLLLLLPLAALSFRRGWFSNGEW